MGRRPAQPTSATTPTDLDPAHRKFLASSLDRNDTELAALEKLNGQLRELRALLVERYGELSLFPMESTASCTSQTSSLSDGGNEEKERLLLSFRLRLKLRRKLLNRLTRRLNRAAHFLDGDVSSLLPPPNPKYGDTPFEFETEKFNEHKQACAKREKAYGIFQEKKRRLNDNLAEKYVLDAQETISLVDESKGGKSHENTLDESELKLDAVPILELIELDVGYQDDQKKSNHDAPEYATLKFGAGVGATHKSMSSKEKEVEFARWSQDILARIPEQPTFEQLGMGDKEVFLLEERKKKLLEQLKKQQRSTDEESISEESFEEKDSEDLTTKNEGVISKPPAEETDETQPEKIPKNKVYLSLQPVPSFAQQDLRRIRSIHADYVSSTIFKQYKAKVDEAATEYSETVARSTELQNLKIRLQSDLHKALVYSRSMAQKTRTDVAVARAKWERRRENWEAVQQARRRSQSDTNSRLEIIHLLHLMVDEVERRSLVHPEKISAPTHSITSNDVVSEIVSVTMKDLVNTIVDRNIAPTPGPHGEFTFGPTRVAEWNYDLSRESFDDFVAPPTPSELELSSSRKQEEQESLLRRQIAAVEARFVASEEDRKRVWRKLQKLRAEFDQQQVQLSTQGSSAQQQQQASSTTVNRTRAAAPPTAHQSQTLKHQASSSAVQPHSAVATRQTMASETLTSVPTSARGTMVPAVASEAASVSSASQSHPNPSVEATTSTSNVDGVPEALVSAYVAAVESTGSWHSEDAGGQLSSKPGDKYGGKYSVEKVRERIYPDGSVLPVQVPKRNKDGLYQRPAGRQRKGMDWDAERGVWIPLPGYSQEAG